MDDKDSTTGPLTMDDDNPEECTVCCDNYDKALRRPRILHCGHTFCSRCIENSIQNDQLSCPICRTEHTATVVTEFSINYSLEGFIRKRLKDWPGSESKKLRTLMQEQKNSIGRLITGCDEALAQLGKYNGQLEEWKTEHHQIQERLLGLVAKSKAATDLLDQEGTSVVDRVTQGQKKKKELEKVLGCLNTVVSEQVVDTTEDVEDWLKKCREAFPNVNSVHTSVQLQETIKEALVAIEEGTMADPFHLEDSDSTIMEKVAKIAGGILQLSVEQLRMISAPIKKLVKAGRVFAVQQDHDELGSARISSRDGQLYLHTLLRQPPPAHACTLEHRDVVGLLNPSSTLAFLDLQWGGTTKGRVTIRLSPDTKLARQFVLLCTGKRGFTYAGTKLLQVCAKGQPGEWVLGGDYENNDGEGGAPLLPDIQGEYRESRSAGAVRSPWWRGTEERQCAQFVIRTRDLPGGMWTGVFGEVESGLEVAKAAASQPDIREVTVVDCGVVLPL